MVNAVVSAFCTERVCNPPEPGSLRLRLSETDPGLALSVTTKSPAACHPKPVWTGRSEALGLPLSSPSIGQAQVLRQGWEVTDQSSTTAHLVHSCSSTARLYSPDWPLSPTWCSCCSVCITASRSVVRRDLSDAARPCSCAASSSGALLSGCSRDRVCRSPAGDPAPGTRPRYVQPKVQTATQS